MSVKPSIKLLGEDGNIFAMLGRASTALRRADLAEQAKEMSSACLTATATMMR